MKNIKHLTALFLSTFLFLGALTPVSAYMKAEYDRNSYPEEKYMGMLRIISYTRESLDSNKMHTGNITMYIDDNGTIKKINVPDTLSSHDVFPADVLRDDVKNYTIKSIEPYIPADFKFGANLYGTDIIFPEYPNHFFGKTNKLHNRNDYTAAYSPYLVSDLQFDNFKLTEKGIEYNYTCGLPKSGLPYVKEYLRKREADKTTTTPPGEKSPSEQYVEYLYNLVGGYGGTDLKYASQIEGIRYKSETELAKMDGYIWFVPFVITLEHKTQPDIVVYDGSYTRDEKRLKYQYKVVLKGMEKVENVPVKDDLEKTPRIIPLLEKDKPILITNDVSYPSETAVNIDVFVNPDKDTPENEITYDNNIYKANDDLDLRVDKIEVEKMYPPDTEITVPVAIYNTADREIITDVTLNYKGKVKAVKFIGNSYVVFQVVTPKTGCMTLTAEINKNRNIKESTYANNKKSVQICVEKEKIDPPSPSGTCKAFTDWKEKDYRWEEKSYESCHTNSKGEEVCHTEYKLEKVWYDFGYRATLKAHLILIPFRNYSILYVLSNLLM